MAVEAKRGCGYRKEGGLYLMGGKLAAPCCLLPHPLDVCPTCGAGIKQARGWTWIEPAKLFNFETAPCNGSIEPAAFWSHAPYEPCSLPTLKGRHGLIWVGERFYPTPGDFQYEGRTLGVSRRINSVPHGFVLGETYVLFAHPKAVTTKEAYPRLGIKSEKGPGIFSVFQPTSIEIIVKESELTDEKRAELEKRGLTPVAVPNDDPDHCPRKAA